MEAVPIRILILEDEDAHAEAIRRALEDADPGVHVRIVSTLRRLPESSR